MSCTIIFQAGVPIRLFHKEIEAYLVAEGLFEDEVTEDGKFDDDADDDFGYSDDDDDYVVDGLFV